MITEYIMYDRLKAEGFIRRDDWEEILKALNMNVSVLDKRLSAVEVSEFLGVSPARVRRYIRSEKAHGREVMDTDGKITFRRMLESNWDALTTKNKTYINN